MSIRRSTRTPTTELSAASGQAFLAFNPNANNAVNALAVSASELHAGGLFTNIGGQDRNRIAALSTASGNAFSGFNPDANGFVFALAASPSTLYAGGSFDGIGGRPRRGYAQFTAP